MPDITKVTVSRAWSLSERKQVLGLIRQELSRLAEELEMLLATDRHSQPHLFQENRQKRFRLRDLEFRVQTSSSFFLNENRDKFSEFVL